MELPELDARLQPIVTFIEDHGLVDRSTPLVLTQRGVGVLTALLAAADPRESVEGSREVFFDVLKVLALLGHQPPSVGSMTGH